MEPEEMAAQAKLDAIREDLVSDELREAVLQAARAAAMHRQAETVAVLRDVELVAALAGGDMAAATEAAGQGMVIERLRARLPSPEVAPDIIAAALAAASLVVDAAEPPPLPITAYERELAAYRELTPRWQATVEPPTLLPADRDARLAIAGLSQARVAVTSTLAAWRHNISTPGAGDPLALLAAAADTAALAGRYTVDQGAVTEIVAEANRARAAAGFTWQPPTGGAPAVPELAIRSTS